MDEPIVLLAGQIPQQRFALQRVVRFRRQVEPRHIHAMGGLGFNVAVLDQPVRQRGFADGAFADQHDLGVDVAAGWNSTQHG